MTTASFSSLGLKQPLLDSIDQLGYEQATPIQTETIPVALRGVDLIGLSQTGSGKTAAFALPGLNGLDLDRAATQVLVLCPTRELAVQVCEEVRRLSARMPGVKAIPVYGGAPMHRQTKGLQAGAHIVVGTPGRILDHLERKNLQTEHIRMVVLDEADRMLDMGFKEDMEQILSQTPKERQTLFFSATMNKAVERLIAGFSRNPETVAIERKAMTVDSVEQVYYEVRNRSKIEVLSRLLDMQPPKRGIVFCNTKQMVDDCCEALLARGYAADRIHGDITQQGRERVIARFREGSVELLVATDVAARGLDIEHVEAVFNYDLPYDPEDYIHRIGRTGRAGRSGRAITFVFGRDIYRLQAIERFIRQPLKRTQIPSQEEVQGHRTDRIFNEVRERLENGDFKNHETLVDRLLDQGFTPTDIAGALFTMLRTDDGRPLESIQEDTKPFSPEASRPTNKPSKAKAKGGFKKRPFDRGKSGHGKPFPSKGKPSKAKGKAEKPAWAERKSRPPKKGGAPGSPKRPK